MSHIIRITPSYLGILILFFSVLSCTNTEESVEEVNEAQYAPKTKLDELNVYVIAGDYYEMKIGVRGDELTGVYKNPLAKEGESCFFFFEGKLGTENPVKVTCYNPMTTDAPFEATYKMIGDALIAKLSKAPHNYCNKEFVDEVGHSVVLDLKHEWSSVRVVQVQSDLTDDTETGASNGITLKRGTVVAVKEKRKNWLLVDLVDQEGAEGWIDETILYPLVSL